MNSGELIWKEEIEIPSHMVDFYGRIKFYYICHYLFDIASRHAHSLHWGFDDLRDQKQYWVLSRLHVKMMKYPGMHDKIHFETWPKGISRLFALRDFRFCTGEDETICLATTAWLIVDSTTGRPVKITDYADLNNFNTGKHSIEEVPGKLPAVDDPENIREISVNYSDLDINKHVTSGKYIEWIQNCFDTQLYEKHNVREFQMNFLSETRPGENISLHWMTDKHSDTDHFFEGIKGSYDHPVFRAFVKFGQDF